LWQSAGVRTSGDEEEKDDRRRIMTRTALALAALLATSGVASAGFDAGSAFEYPTWYPQFPLTANPSADRMTTGSITRTRRPSSHVSTMTSTKSLAKSPKKYSHARPRADSRH
jgi:hypothetical protein